MNLFSPTDSKQTFEYDNSLWLKVFFHNHSTKVCFDNELEALHCNSQYKFSILDEITPKMRVNEMYEFIIEFPADKAFIRWVQRKNPVREAEVENVTKSKDFKLISKNINLTHSFNGLVKSTMKINDKISCLLDGNPGIASWWYAIGMYKDSDDNFKNIGIPGYKGETSSIRLWIRLPRNIRGCTRRTKQISNTLMFVIITHIYK